MACQDYFTNFELVVKAWELCEGNDLPICNSRRAWLSLWCCIYQMSLITRKPVFGIFDQIGLKPACLATETSYSLEILDIASESILLSKQRTTKTLICVFVVRI